MLSSHGLSDSSIESARHLHTNVKGTVVELVAVKALCLIPFQEAHNSLQVDLHVISAALWRQGAMQSSA